MSGRLTERGQHIIAALSGRASAFAVSSHGELTIAVEADAIAEVVRFLRDDPQCRFVCFIDLCGVDYPGRTARFDVVYHLLSPYLNQRIRVKVAVAEGEAVPSLSGVFPAANWFEREAFDLFGIPFSGHPDMRRLLTDYGFEGHPLRKDFPLTGYVEVRYDEEQKRVIYEPVKLGQEMRSFDFLSPWEGGQNWPGESTGYALPGDEKASVT